jgi:ATP-dependent helicase/nuclease subunit B
VHVRLLLGPAGSGKTFRCQAEVGEALRVSAEGPPLVFLAPRQATFQLERQLLGAAGVAGYTRLQILSFPRLAEEVLQRQRRPTPPLLSEEGRLMVLRALLGAYRDELRLFHATARLPGFARHLSSVLRELQHHQLTPARLEEVAARVSHHGRLNDKLRDLALVLRAYLDWLAAHGLEDADRLLDLAGQALRRPDQPPATSAGLGWDALWLDGFAEMTPQELDLLTAVLPHCRQATLAFCLDEPGARQTPWFSAWAPVSRTYERLCERVSALPDVTVTVERLPRESAVHRFVGNPVLHHLEKHWTAPEPFSGRLDCLPGGAPAPGQGRGSAVLRVVAALNPEAEAKVAARELLRFVRNQGGRYRAAAVLVRSLDDYHHVLRRVFTRYGIPFFLDRRESVAHHALAELTRYAVRTVAYGWQHEDWFGALKTGLVSEDDAALDRLENEALARGWQGTAWQAQLPIGDDAELAEWAESVRARLVPPFHRLARALGASPPQAAEGRTGRPTAAPRPTGAQLANALRALWTDLTVEARQEQWSRGQPARAARSDDNATAAMHATVWEQMNRWLEDLARAFAHEPMALPEWLPILEAGLSNLTVGVIPPALDQVLVGAIDRSRNPDLRLVLVLGLNESVFPAPPPPSQVLTESDRQSLALVNVDLGPGRRHQLGRERFYGYIACTRARERLVLTYALRDARDRPLLPSPFLAHLQRLFPSLQVETVSTEDDWTRSEHRCELVERGLKPPAPAVGESDAAWADLAAMLGPLPPARPATPEESLSPMVAEALYGPILRTSVSRLEQYAACPFKFFVHSGLRAEERKRFVIDPRQRGSFQHEILARFHQEVRREGKEWRDLTPEEARARIRRIAEERTRGYGAGLFQADEQSLFTARSLTLALEDFIQTVVSWMRSSYQFNPRAVELPFGGSDAPLPGWELDLGEGHRMTFHGIIDRVDLAQDPATGEVVCVVLDYKSREQKIEPLLLAGGVQMQLPAYLAALRRLPGLEAVLGVARPLPAGAFYVGLRGPSGRAESRRAARADPEQARRESYRHRGRFRLAALPLLDRLCSQGAPSSQFSCAPGGKLNLTYRDPLPDAELDQLLDAVEERLRDFGREIFAGWAKVDPYLRTAGDVACLRCDFRSICRIDPWTHAYRRLAQAAGPSAGFVLAKEGEGG